MPEIGQSMVIGRLHSMGFHSVQRERVRVAIRAVDPLNTALRAPGALTRRQPYSVPGPNSLWLSDIAESIRPQFFVQIDNFLGHWHKSLL